MDGGFLLMIISATILKLLLVESYFSTDFEVHRNWLAITNSLSISQWYYEDRSEWTLDYPPLFAWFEWILSHFARLVDEKIVDINNLNYTSKGTVYFQRASVILTDFVYYYAVYSVILIRKDLNFQKQFIKSSEDYLVMLFLLIFNYGLLVVDHIHFQYNGLLTGILMLSIVSLLQNRPFHAAFYFALLLNMKHIYLYMAPVYFIYLLAHHCFQQKQLNPKSKKVVYHFSYPVFIKLGVIVVGVFSVSFGPFILMGQLGQVLSRLFPFKRGLCHAYWAPNIWALYNFVDKCLFVIGKNLDLVASNGTSVASMTGGLVQEYDHSILPNILPVYTVVLTVLSIIPILINLAVCDLHPGRKFLEALIMCAYSSFMFGWHVHEKAIIMVIVPLTLLVFICKSYASVFIHLSTIGHYSLLPLIITPAETAFKLTFLMFYTSVAILGLLRRYSSSNAKTSPLIPRLEMINLLGLIPLQIYSNFIHSYLGLEERLPFLPLMMTSVYCSLGLCLSYKNLYSITMREVELNLHSEKQKML